MPVSSCRRRPKPEMSGLSCMLFPFLPRSPQRTRSAVPSPVMFAAALLLLPLPRDTEFEGPSCTGLGPPPRIAATDEWGDRACFCMAEVIAMHSAMTRETGSTATETGRLRYCMRGEWCCARRGSGVVGREGAGEIEGSIMCETGASWLILGRRTVEKMRPLVRKRVLSASELVCGE